MNLRLNPRLTDSSFVPNVRILLPLAAWSCCEMLLFARSFLDAGKIVTSDPVSIRKRVLFVRSKITIRRLSDTPATTADDDGEDSSFLNSMNMVRGTAQHRFRTFDGTSTFRIVKRNENHSD